jgi:type II secretion system protein G
MRYDCPNFRRAARGDVYNKWLMGIGVLLAVLWGAPSIWPELLPALAGRDGCGDRRGATQADLRNMAAAIELFSDDTGRYPTTEEGLAALVDAPEGLEDWRGPYLKKIVPDKWGTPYRYCYPGPRSGGAFDLISAGGDRKLGTRDDLVYEHNP